MRLLDDPGSHLTLDAILRVRLDIPADKGHFTLGLFLNIPVDNDIRLRRPHESQLSGLIFLVEPYRGMVIRIIHGVELLPPVASEEFVIGNTRSLVNLVCELTFLDGYFQAVVGISGRLVRHHPKHLDHVENTHRRGIRVHAIFVHFHTARSGSKMSAFVPFFPGGSVCCFQFGQSVKFILVRLDTL